MVAPVFNATSAFFGWLGKARHRAMFSLQPKGGDYTGGADSDMDATSGVTAAWAEGVVLVDPATGKAVAGASVGTATSVLSATPGAGVAFSVLAANTGRKGFTLYNDKLAGAGTTIYILCSGAGEVSATNYTYQLAPATGIDIPAAGYAGRIRGMFLAALGTLMITEYTA